MKLILNGYEVEIKAKDIGKERYNKLDTMCFLNSISIIAHEAAEHNKTIGHNAIYRKEQKIAMTIYKYLLDKGLYN